VRIKFGKYSRTLRDFFPKLPGMFSVFDKPHREHAIWQKELSAERGCAL
jgi:hypothetical protein